MKKKGISLPVNMLVILSISIVVLLATVAFFMGTFSQSSEGTKSRADFNSACSSWTNSNCAEEAEGDHVPDHICGAYNKMQGGSGNTDCNHEEVASACGCTPPYGTGGNCAGEGVGCSNDSDCCSGDCNTTSGKCL